MPRARNKLYHSAEAAKPAQSVPGKLTRNYVCTLLGLQVTAPVEPSNASPAAMNPKPRSSCMATCPLLQVTGHYKPAGQFPKEAHSWLFGAQSSGTEQQRC